MSNVKTTCLRFNLDNPEHAKAWRNLKQADTGILKSCNSTVIKAVNEYFDNYRKTQDDPYFETRQREERFVQQKGRYDKQKTKPLNLSETQR